MTATFCGGPYAGLTMVVLEWPASYTPQLGERVLCDYEPRGPGRIAITTIRKVLHAS